MTPEARVAVVALVSAALLTPASGAPQATTAGSAETPREIGLVERTGRGLVQLDVTVRGTPQAIADLGPEDFELVVNARPIAELIVDRVCPAQDAPRAAEALGATQALDAAVGATPAVSYLFYFDQHHLTMAGRQNSVDLAQQMIPELLGGGGRAAVVSSGKELATLVDLTDDVDALLAGLEALEKDRRQWDTYPQEEEFRIRDVVETLRNNGLPTACGVARRYQLEESFRTDKALRRLSIVLGLLADLDPPKAVVYFADTMRASAGQHYYGYIGRCGGAGEGGAASEPGSFGSEHALDRVVHEASANGIRLYTVQAQGLVTGDSSVLPGLGTRANQRTNQQRVRDAQNSLGSLALETGGQAFLNGVPATKIVRAIEDDLECLYLISFDPGDLPLDAPLRVLLRAKRPKVQVQTRGQLILQSESSRRTSRLLSAFVTPESVRTDAALRGAVVPTGFADGRYTALVQVQAPASPLPEASWDIGVSLVSRGEMREDESGRIAVQQPGVPIVFETEMTFGPGPFELVLVAHETVADQLATTRIEDSWPERGGDVAVGPIALLQPGSGVFLRDGELRGDGAVGRAPQDLVLTELPTALIGLVCRGSSKKAALRVERSLTGEAATEFDTLQIDLREERCAQIRDLIPPRTMTEGRFAYEIRVLDGDEQLAAGQREFVAVSDQASADGS